IMGGPAPQAGSKTNDDRGRRSAAVPPSIRRSPARLTPAVAMDKQNRKLSPLEFLAQLKAGAKSSKPSSAKGGTATLDQTAEVTDLTAAAKAAALLQQATSDAEGDAKSGENLNQLFERVNLPLGQGQPADEKSYIPPEPQTIAETGLTSEDI